MRVGRVYIDLKWVSAPLDDVPRRFPGALTLLARKLVFQLCLSFADQPWSGAVTRNWVSPGVEQNRERGGKAVQIQVGFVMLTSSTGSYQVSP